MKQQQRQFTTARISNFFEDMGPPSPCKVRNEAKPERQNVPTTSQMQQQNLVMREFDGKVGRMRNELPHAKAMT